MVLIFGTVLALIARFVSHLEKGELRQTSADGNRVILLIKQHRETWGSYPLSLNQLDAKALAAIPPPAWGDGKWRYQTTANGFNLYVLVQSDRPIPIYCYDSQMGRWYIDD